MRAPDGPSVKAFLAGVLSANSLAHLATATAGKQHLTPLAGRSSGPAVNAAWGAANLVGGLVLARAASGHKRRWDHRLVAFDAGAAVFGAWMAGSEALARVNSGPSADELSRPRLAPQRLSLAWATLPGLGHSHPVAAG